MKKCTQCGTAYTDETLRFCLADGTALTTVGDSEPTVIAGHRDNLRVDIPTDRPPNFQPPPTTAKSSSGRWLKVLAAVLVLGFAALVIVAAAGAYIYYKSGKQQPAFVEKTPTPKPSVSPTPDSEKQKLQDELANLQKKLDEQKSGVSNNRPFPTPDVNAVPTARVNSPNDGFLALRSEPDAEYGQRIAKIPHGTVIELNNCEKNQVTIAGRKGRWCLVTYGDYAGYVFDAFLIY